MQDVEYRSTPTSNSTCQQILAKNLSKARTLHLPRNGNERGTKQFRHRDDKEDKGLLSNILRHLLDEAKRYWASFRDPYWFPWKCK